MIIIKEGEILYKAGTDYISIFTSGEWIRVGIDEKRNQRDLRTLLNDIKTYATYFWGEFKRIGGSLWGR